MNSIIDPTRLEHALQVYQPGYKTAPPFPHAVLEHAFDPAVLRELAGMFPPLDNSAWNSRFGTGGTGGKSAASGTEAKKHASTDLGAMPVELASALLELNMSYFLYWLERLTGIDGLLPDPYFIGGGLHAVERGGHLGIHTDFNRHPKLKLDRRLNVLIYLNEGWDESWGGQLGLYDHEYLRDENGTCAGHPFRPTGADPVVRVQPELGTCVVFSTSPWSFHGHPEPLTCPPGVVRKSLALYYYTAGRPEHERAGGPDGHSTLFFGKAGP